jgi:hypothetical protein
LRRGDGSIRGDNEHVPTKMPEGYVSSRAAREMILQGTAPEELWTDRLLFEGIAEEIVLPPKLKVRTLEVRNCPQFRALPEGLFAQEVIIAGCPGFTTISPKAWSSRMSLDNCSALEILPPVASTIEVRRCPKVALAERFSCATLRMPGCELETVPGRLIVSQELDLRNSPVLREIPNLELWLLELRGCTRLEHLPQQLRAGGLGLAGCTGLRWQQWADVEVGSLDVSDCPQIRTIPEWLIVTDSIDVANSGLGELPDHLRSCRLTWRGVTVDERIAFQPESIAPSEVLQERNSERRRVMLERVGWERFFAEARPQVVDRDRDPGGERLLMRFQFENENEPALVLAVQCPSTARKYFIRVPPRVRTCHEGAAWIAGFDNPDEYEPVLET